MICPNFCLLTMFLDFFEKKQNKLNPVNLIFLIEKNRILIIIIVIIIINSNKLFDLLKN